MTRRGRLIFPAYQSGMVRKRKPQTSNVKMYQHFAIITVAATGLLAMFADGENREAMAEEIVEEGQMLVSGEAEESQGLRRRTTRSPNAASSWGDDSSNIAYGQPMDTTGGSVSDSGVAPTSNAGSLNGPSLFAALAELGISREEFEQMTPQERRSARARAEAKRKEQARTLLAASRARSGSGSSSEI